MITFTAKTANQILNGTNVDFVIEYLSTFIKHRANTGHSYYFHDTQSEMGQWVATSRDSLTGLRNPVVIQKVLYQLKVVGFNAELVSTDTDQGILIWWYGDKPVLEPKS